MANPFEKTACEYDRWFEREGVLLYLSELLAYQRILSPLNRWEKVLDVGVGTGRFAVFEKTVGVDPAYSMLKLAAGRGVLPVKGICEKLPLKENSFDLISVITALCFVKDQPLCVRECRRVLKSGGTLILGFINRESEWGKLYIKKAESGHPIYSRAKFLSFEEVKGLFKGLFEIDRVVSTLFTTEHKLFIPEEGLKKGAGFVLVRASAV